MVTKSKIIDVQVNIDSNHVLTYTTPDNVSQSKSYPLHWTEAQILNDFMTAFRKALAESAPEATVNIKSITRVGEA
jgi:hypothetical protein